MDPHRCFRSEYLGVDSELECAWRSRIERAAACQLSTRAASIVVFASASAVADCLMLDDLLDASTLSRFGEERAN